MHDKDRAIGEPLSRLGLSVALVADVDTDSLGAFTGEISRSGSMLDAALAKARLAMAHSGAPIGLGSEGAFGPHPIVPFLASGVGLIVLRDGERGLEITAQRRTRTSYDSTDCGAPGFGVETVLRGLPCADCGAPTRIVRGELHRCRRCGASKRKGICARRPCAPMRSAAISATPEPLRNNPPASSVRASRRPRRR